MAQMSVWPYCMLGHLSYVTVQPHRLSLQARKIGSEWRLRPLDIAEYQQRCQFPRLRIQTQACWNLWSSLADFARWVSDCPCFEGLQSWACRESVLEESSQVLAGRLSVTGLENVATEERC